MARLAAVVALVLAAARGGLALLSFTTPAWAVQAGKPFTIQWAGNGGPVTLNLVNGTEGQYKQVLVIDSVFDILLWYPFLLEPTTTRCL